MTINFKPNTFYPTTTRKKFIPTILRPENK